MVARFLYRYVFKRTSTFVLGIFVTSMFFERAYDHVCEEIFEWVNEGRLWMHIKHKYEDPLKEMKHKCKLVEEKSSNSQKEPGKVRK